MAKRGRPVQNKWRIFNSHHLMELYFKHPEKYPNIDEISHEISEHDIKQWVPIARYYFDELYFHNIYPHNIKHNIYRQGALFRIVDVRTGVIYPAKRYLSKQDATYNRYKILVGFITPVDTTQI